MATMVEITPTATGYAIVVDGHDISHLVQSINVHLSAGGASPLVPHVAIDLVGDNVSMQLPDVVLRALALTQKGA